MPLLILVHVVMFDDEINRFEQEAAGWIADGIVGSRLDAIDDRFDEFARRKVLPRAFGAFLGTLFEQSFVDIPFGIGLHTGPVLGVDQFNDQAAKRGGVLDILPRLFEDRPEHPGLLAQFIEDMPVVSFEFFAVALQQAGPIESFGHDLFVVRRLRLLVGHFQKEQKRDLLGVSHVGKPIIAQDMGKVPSFVDNLFGVGHVVLRRFAVVGVVVDCIRGSVS